MPARSAVVGVADRLFVVGPGCSSSSSFSSSSSSAAAALGPMQGGSLARSLALVASALRLSTRRSVVVLDELGAGTLSADGAGLAAAAAASLGARGARALLPTHHGELARSSLMARLGDFFGGFAGGENITSSSSPSSFSLAERVGVASMKVLVREIEEEEGEEAAEEGEEEQDQEDAAAESKGQQNKKKTKSKKRLLVTPLFRLEPAPDGQAPAYGLAAAAAAGMPAAVVRRAEAVAAAVAAAAAAAGNNTTLDDFSSSSATDPRLSAASARAARRAAALLARVATLPVASSVQGGRLCEEARALLEEALLLEDGQ